MLAYSSPVKPKLARQRPSDTVSPNSIAFAFDFNTVLDHPDDIILSLTFINVLNTTCVSSIDFKSVNTCASGKCSLKIR